MVMDNIFIKKYKSKKEKPISEDEQLLIRKAIKEFCRDLNIATSINLSHDKIFEECLFNHICNLYKNTILINTFIKSIVQINNSSTFH